MIFSDSKEAEFISQSIGQTGKVLRVDSDGDVKIEVSGSSWTYNPLCLIPANKDSISKVCVCHMFVDTTDHIHIVFVQFNPGDMVRVLDDADVVRHLQNGHGDWVDSMSAVCLC